MTSVDPIEAFYERHPYPPPVTDLDALVARDGDRTEARVAHHRTWPGRPPADIRSVLVAGCGTSQAARHAVRRPDASVVGIDVSASSLAHTRRLAEQHQLGNLEVRDLPIERAEELGTTFDHVVCTGVLHHLADPLEGLRALQRVLAPGGAITLMVYAPYGRTGVYLVQDYCRRLGVSTDPSDIADLVSTLREIPSGHPISRLLRDTRDFHDDDALADALLNPRDRAFSVPELLTLLDDAGLRFGRWERQAPYLPDCGSISETPHGERIAAMTPAEQYAALELFRGTMVRHTVIAHRADDTSTGRFDFGSPAAWGWRPVPVTTSLAVEERLPPGAAAALLNRAHTDTDLVLFVDRPQFDTYRRIDGRRTIADIGADPHFVERIFRHDLVVIDATEDVS